MYGPLPVCILRSHQQLQCSHWHIMYRALFGVQMIRRIKQKLWRTVTWWNKPFDYVQIKQHQYQQKTQLKFLIHAYIAMINVPTNRPQLYVLVSTKAGWRTKHYSEPTRTKGNTNAMYATSSQCRAQFQYHFDSLLTV